MTVQYTQETSKLSLTLRLASIKREGGLVIIPCRQRMVSLSPDSLDPKGISSEYVMHFIPGGRTWEAASLSSLQGTHPHTAATISSVPAP